MAGGHEGSIVEPLARYFFNLAHVRALVIDGARGAEEE
jgi:hypothetical protein